MVVCSKNRTNKNNRVWKEIEVICSKNWNKEVKTKICLETDDNPFLYYNFNKQDVREVRNGTNKVFEKRLKSLVVKMEQTRGSGSTNGTDKMFGKELNTFVVKMEQTRDSGSKK